MNNLLFVTIVAGSLVFLLNDAGKINLPSAVDFWSQENATAVPDNLDQTVPAVVSPKPELAPSIPVEPVQAVKTSEKPLLVGDEAPPVSIGQEPAIKLDGHGDEVHTTSGTSDSATLRESQEDLEPDHSATSPEAAPSEKTDTDTLALEEEMEIPAAETPTETLKDSGNPAATIPTSGVVDPAISSPPSLFPPDAQFMSPSERARELDALIAEMEALYLEFSTK